MNFFDEARIYVKAGNGGGGSCSFRREAHVAFGGPDGGNGGRGGHVIFKSSTNLNTLIDFKFKQHYKAKAGGQGKGQNRHGANGEDTVLQVPLGTQIYDDDDNMLCDFDKEDQEYILLKGGEGGRGNASFKSSINRAPKISNPGEPTEEQIIHLRLKIFSDVGLVGFPNAGKSTLISVLSKAQPKVADYPFTTLKPYLGVVVYDDKDFVIADIPGLIEGASDGMGLGHKFLKHIERCKTILHIIDVTAESPNKSYEIIRNELTKYSDLLMDKKEIIVLNKIDLVFEEDLPEIIKSLQESTGKEIIAISAASLINLDQLKQRIVKELLD
ncbi:MAG: GTPase ObgE [Rickettsiales bacterium]|jgi:GTPase|nr:GTPase ObgE [Rickettsiales bacterium]